MARVEQTETPDMMTERVRTQTKKATKFDKVVAREVCQVTNRGTQVFGQQCNLSNDHQPNYMLAIAERSSTVPVRFGVCFIDTSLAEFHIGEFDDDQHRSRLLTMLSHHPPALLLSERGALSPATAQIFKSVLANVLQERLLSDSQFWSAPKTLKHMAERYFSPKLVSTEWPSLFVRMQMADDPLGLTPANDWSLALRSVGACLWYMSKCLVDAQIMSMAQFGVYDPPDMQQQKMAVDAVGSEIVRKTAAMSLRHRSMVLDAISLSNLKICNDERSLLATLDNCCTKFGKRALQRWVCTPSCDRTVIGRRQRAVGELMGSGQLLQAIRLALGAVPDLERQLAQIHTFGDARRKETHPDGRAIFFEQKTYNKKKIQVNLFEFILGSTVLYS